MTKAQKTIYDILISDLREWSIEELVLRTWLDRTVVHRHLQSLIKSGYIEKSGYGKYRGVIWAVEYLEKPFFERKAVEYNPDFLSLYIPNVSSFLWERLSRLEEATKDIREFSTFDYMKNRRGIENFLTDLSYASSKLEGNTYSHLDTEVLIKYRESAEGKTKEETTMILNHKDALEYIIASRSWFNLIKKDFCEIHTLLAKWLIHDTYLGIFRTTPVQIGSSRYVPISISSLLESEFSLFLEKLRAIKNPFEQSLFILVFIPYFQAFIDINKRTSRLSANIPLISQWLPPISLMQIKEKMYINAILAVYELNDVSLMADLFLENYLLNMHRYI